MCEWAQTPGCLQALSEADGCDPKMDERSGAKSQDIVLRLIGKLPSNLNFGPNVPVLIFSDL